MKEEVEGKTKIFDAHMHIGRAFKATNTGCFKEYVVCAKNAGICEAIVIPPCIPDYQVLPSGEQFIPFLYHNGECVQAKMNGQKVTYDRVKTDPFSSINRKLFLETCNYSFDISLHFAPLVHPLYWDSSVFSEEEWKKIIAIKIHPGCFGITPFEVSREFFLNVESMKKPLIIHTGLKNSLALDWLNVLADYSIKAMFTHACRLNPSCAARIFSDDRYCVGIAPYKKLDNMNQFVEYESFLSGVLSMFDISQIVFDSDYPENIDKDGNLYWDFRNDLDELHVSAAEQEKILFANGKSFFT